MALVAAFVAAPAPLAATSTTQFADQHEIAAALREGFVEYWASGARELSPGLQAVVDYWLRYHVAKAVFAAALLVVLVALSVAVWKAFLRAERTGRRSALASAGVGLTMLAVLSLATVMANVQGAAAPFASLLSMLPVGTQDAGLAGPLDEVRHGLSEANARPAALDVMVDDFAAYHAVLAVIATVVTMGLVAASVVLWRRGRQAALADRRTGRLLRSFGAFCAFLVLGEGVVAVANTATAAHPAPALLDFFAGGW
ncbi:MAG: hypothetical protein HOV79_23210 [Hamadaea sp.]|nr:hypothetical protein [Hamadaea sp.]